MLPYCTDKLVNSCQFISLGCDSEISGFCKDEEHRLQSRTTWVLIQALPHSV